jgi:hypothetical protein
MKSIKTEVKWAFIFIVMMLAWMLMEKLTGLYSENIEWHPVVTNFVAIPAITVYVLALLDKRKKDYNGVMTYGQGFKSGLIITLIVTLFTPLTQYLTTEVIAPEYFPNAIAYTVDNGFMTQSDAEAFFNLKSYMIQSTIGAPIMGIVTTAIVAIFTRKKG